MGTNATQVLSKNFTALCSAQTGLTQGIDIYRYLLLGTKIAFIKFEFLPINFALYKMFKTLKNLVGGLALAFTAMSANATLLDIHFTASGSATGQGDAIVDSSLLKLNTQICCQVPPSTFKSLDLTLNFGAGDTSFHLSDLNSTYFVMSVGSQISSFNDLNFWAKNADGVMLTGTSPFHDAASGAKGANGTVVYAVNSVTTVSVPEPGSLALIGLGLVGVVAARRRMI